MKDYYKILNVAINASFLDIKKAYRSLAMRYHPDKNAGNKSAEAFFEEVQEAYAILKDPHTRQIYTRKKFHSITALQKKTGVVSFTPGQFLDECMQLETYVQSLDFFRMDKAGLHFYIIQKLSPAISMLNQFADKTVNDKIIISIVHSCQPLTLKDMIDIIDLLSGIKMKSEATDAVLQKITKSKRQEAFWDKYKIFVLILITLLICLFIYVVGKA